jgi:hypothetical protein
MDPREWLFDKRVVRRNLDKSVLTWKAHKDYLKGLADLEGDTESLAIDSRGRVDEAAGGGADGAAGAGSDG